MTNQQKMEAGIQKWKDHLETLTNEEYTQYAHNCAARLGDYAKQIEAGLFLDGINYADLRMAEDFFRSAALKKHTFVMANNVMSILEASL